MKDYLKRTEWMHEKKWGVMVDELYGRVNNPSSPTSLGKCTSWEEALMDFDCEAFAGQLAELGAGWCVLTIMQQRRYMIAPNDTFNRLSGYAPGEACPRYDLIENMYQALSARNISLILYFTAEGVHEETPAGKAFCSRPNGEKYITRGFAEKWASVAREYSLRYGKKIAGWWQDGAWTCEPEDFQVFAEAFRAGNPDAVLATNGYGCTDEYGVLLCEPRGGFPYDDYAAGELVHLGALPRLGASAGNPGNCRWHITSFLGKSPEGRDEASGWGKPGSRYTAGWLFDYVDEIHRRGGIITLDICTDREGKIDPEQFRALRALKAL